MTHIKTLTFFQLLTTPAVSLWFMTTATAPVANDPLDLQDKPAMFSSSVCSRFQHSELRKSVKRKEGGIPNYWPRGSAPYSDASSPGQARRLHAPRSTPCPANN